MIDLCLDNYFKILENIKLLSNAAKRKLLIDISILINVSNNKETTELICPHCKNKYIVKNGKNKETQRYLCKTCKKSFVKSTNTPIFSSKKNLETWIKFIECLINQYSLSKISKELNIAVSTAFIWRHKILDAIREHYKCLDLSSEIQCDETFFQESFKGNHSKDGFVMPRKAHKRGGEARYRGISKEKVCVLTALDNNGGLYIAPIAMGKPSSNDLIRSIGKVIKPKSLLITDSLFSYKILSSFCKISHIAIPKGFHSLKQYNIQKINSLHSNLKRFIAVYKGVSTKYLANYLALFKFVFSKFDKNPINIKGEHPYLSTNFKGRPPIFE